MPKPLIVAALLASLVPALATDSQAQTLLTLSTYTSVGTGTNPDGTTFHFATSGGVAYTFMPDYSGTPGTSGNFLVIPSTTAPGYSGYSAYQSVQIDKTGTSPSANGFTGTFKWGDVRALNGQFSPAILIYSFNVNPIVPGFNQSFYANFPKFSSYYHTVGPSIYVAMNQLNTSNVASAGSTSVW